MKIPPEILTVVERLAELRTEAVFVGGMVRGVLVTDPAVPGVRPTKDVDLIVDSKSQVQHTKLTAHLRRLGFTEDMSDDAPICRYLLRGAGQDDHDLPVDIMPLELLNEMTQAPIPLRQFVANALGDLLADASFLAALPGHLPPDAPSQARHPQLLQRLHALAALTN